MLKLCQHNVKKTATWVGVCVGGGGGGGMPPVPSSALLPMEYGNFRMSGVHIHVRIVVNLLQEVID